MRTADKLASLHVPIVYKFWKSPETPEILTASPDLQRDNFNLLTPTGHVMYQQLNIQQLYVLPTRDAPTV